MATSSTPWRAGIEIAGPDADVLRDYVASAVSRSPSLRRMLERLAGRGQAIQFSTVRGDLGVAFGSAGVRAGWGDAGEHDIDVADLEELPPIATNPPGTSREQMIAHEIAESVAELEMQAYVESLDPNEAADAWSLAHEDALDWENQFREEVGAPGLLVDRVAVQAGSRALVSDSYDTGHVDFFAFP